MLMDVQESTPWSHVWDEEPSSPKSHCKSLSLRLQVLSQSCSIKWASESGVARFFPSEYGTDIEHNAASVNEKPHQLKIKVRAFAKEIENVKFTYLVTGPYSDMYLAKIPWEEIGTWDVKGKRAVLLGTGDEKVAFTTMTE